MTTGKQEVEHQKQALEATHGAVAERTQSCRLIVFVNTLRCELCVFAVKMVYIAGH
jgi:hypothetical protein